MTPSRSRLAWKASAPPTASWPGHRVDDEERVVGLDRLGDLADLLHQLLVDGETAGGVDDDDVAARRRASAIGALGDGDRVGRLGEDRHVDAGGRACGAARPRPDAGGRRRRAAGATLRLEPAGELGRVGGLARTLQAGHQHDGRRLRGEGDAHRLAAEGLGELLVDDLDDLLGRVQRLADLRADARSRMRPCRLRTTVTLTSASSRARRISRRTSSTCRS